MRARPCSHAHTDFNLPNAHPAFFEASLRMGEAVVLFDGLDETGDAPIRHRISTIIQTFQSEYPHCPVFVTSRIYGYTSSIQLHKHRFTHLRLNRLTPEQIKDFISRWYSIQLPHNERERTEYTQSLREAVHRNPSVRLLASNPLLLTLMTFIHQGLRKLPQDRGELYEKCVDMLLKTWQEAKHFDRSTKSHPFELLNLHAQTQKTYLAHLALHIQEKSKSSNGTDSRGLITRTEALEHLTNKHFKTSKRYRPDLSTHVARSEMADFLDYVGDRTGLLIDRGGEQLSFIHLSFQEYLSAWVFTSNPKNSVDTKFFTERLGNPAWEEVLLLRLYIILNTPGGGGEESFDTIIDAIIEAIKSKNIHQGWLTLTRALRDNLIFADHHRSEIISQAIENCLKSPGHGIWFSAVEELVLFAERHRGALHQHLQTISHQAPPRRTIPCLHLEASFFGLGLDTATQLRSHPYLSEMLPDLVAFIASPGIPQLLSDYANHSDWFAAFATLDSPILFRATVNWALQAGSRDISEQGLEAALSLIWSKILAELHSRSRVRAQHESNEHNGICSQSGQIHSKHPHYQVSLPLTAFHAPATGLPKNKPLHAKQLLFPSLAVSQLARTPDYSSDYFEKSFEQWTSGFTQTLLSRHLDTSNKATCGKAALLLTEFFNNYRNTFIQLVRSSALSDLTFTLEKDLRRALRENFGHGFSRAFVRDFAHELERTIAIRLARTIMRKLVRDFDRHLGLPFIRTLPIETVRHFAHALIPTLSHDPTASSRRIYTLQLETDRETAAPTSGVRAILSESFGINTYANNWQPKWDSLFNSHENIHKILNHEDIWVALTGQVGTTTVDIDAPSVQLTCELLNPLSITSALASIASSITTNHTLAYIRHSALGQPHTDSATAWFNSNPLECYQVALAWQQLCLAFRSPSADASDTRLALFIAHGAYAGLMTGIPCELPERLGSSRETDTKGLAYFSKLLHAVCHFDEPQENVARLLSAVKSAPARHTHILRAVGLLSPPEIGD
ncbi:NACHT domain-containing protein [Pyxidicoccus sp. 3LG]